MKLSELRPCDSCGGMLVPQFFIIEVKSMFFSPKAMNVTGGLIHMFGGLNNPGALAIAETMSPEPEVVKELPTGTTLFVCQRCYLNPPPMSDLVILVEKRNRKIQEEEEKKDEMGRSGVGAGPRTEDGTGGERPEEDGTGQEAKTG